MGEPQKRERLRFSLTPLFPGGPRESTKLDQSRFLRMDLQPELRQPFLKLLQEPLRVPLVLESHYKIVSVADHDQVALRHFLAPDLRCRQSSENVVF